MAKARALRLLFTIQDLTNPGLALTQAAGLAAHTFALNGVEANSHQFFPATSAPEAAVHPGIFSRKGGVLRTDTLQGPGLGHQVERIARPLFQQHT